MGNKYKLTNYYEIIDQMRQFSDAHIHYDKNVNNVNYSAFKSKDNAHIVSSVIDYSNGDCSRYDIVTIPLGDIEVSVSMLTLKHGDNVAVYLAPYGGGDLDVEAD